MFISIFIIDPCSTAANVLCCVVRFVGSSGLPKWTGTDEEYHKGYLYTPCV